MIDEGQAIKAMKVRTSQERSESQRKDAKEGTKN